MLGDEPVPLSGGEFRALRDLLRGYAGVRFDDDVAFLVQRRLQPRLHELGLQSFGAYLERLQDPQRPAAARAAELQALFERLATRETYFFRESYQLDALAQEILPPLLRGGEPISLWSAGCSTGEEAYTLAITALRAGARAPRVLGTDLSQVALEAADAAVYGPGAFRQTADELRERYFDREDCGRPRWRVSDEIRRLVTFRPLNLNQPDWDAAGGPHHVILCRNVLIYFDRELRRAVIDRLTRRLVPGGFLLLGHSETLRDEASGLALCPLRHAQVYRRESLSPGAPAGSQGSPGTSEDPRA